MADDAILSTMLSICLFHPEIPQNTGNIARTCAVTGTRLHLVRPLGFDISEKSVRHAGLDYWSEVDITVHDSIEAFMEEHGSDELWFFSKKGQKAYTDQAFRKDGCTYFIFGPESTGLDESLLSAYPDRVLRIPMVHGVRCLNLSNSAAIAAEEYYRQLGFPGFETEWEGAGLREDL